jgi:hypothetical protein
MSTGRGRRSFAGIAIGVVLATSLINLLHWPKPFAPLPPLASLEGRISTIARQEGASRGYADYWDASALTWGSQMAVSVEPVVFCELGVLCPFPFDVVSTWYQPRDTGSFVLQDSTSIWMPFPAPTGLGRPEAVFRLDRRYTMYVYRYDVASRFDDAQTVWAPRLSYGGGFNWAEPFQGTTGRWMEQAGSVRIATGIAVRASVSAMAFSNQRSRTLELVNPSGVVLGKEQIPTYAVPVHFGPFEVPAGTSRFTLIATPGPQILGPTDPRLASIFLEPLTLAATPAIVPNA